MMYNKVEESEIGKYTRPANVHERLWNQAVEANPDTKRLTTFCRDINSPSSRLVPVQATGFHDLKLRLDEQDKTTSQHQKALEVDFPSSTDVEKSSGNTEIHYSSATK